MNDLKTLIQLLAMKELKRETSTIDFAEGGDSALDGLRSMRALARSREIRKRQLTNPDEVVANYRDGGEERLNAQGRQWGWPDAARSVRWKPFRSIHRVYLMLGEAERLHSIGWHR
jgi:hypothetical protein